MRIDGLMHLLWEWRSCSRSGSCSVGEPPRTDSRRKPSQREWIKRNISYKQLETSVDLTRD